MSTATAPATAISKPAKEKKTKVSVGTGEKKATAKEKATAKALAVVKKVTAATASKGKGEKKAKKEKAAAASPAGAVQKPRHYHAGTLSRMRARRYRLGAKRTVSVTTRAEVARMVRKALVELVGSQEILILSDGVLSMVRAALESYMVRRLTRLRHLVKLTGVTLTRRHIATLDAMERVPFNA